MVLLMYFIFGEEIVVKKLLHLMTSMCCLAFCFSLSLLLVSSTYLPDQRAKALLLQYDLHPEEKLEEESITLTPDLIEWIDDQSLDIGLNITDYTGKTVKRLSYILKERSQFNNCRGKITAYVYLNEKNEVIGAYMNLAGYLGGHSSLRDGTNFAPKNLTPQKLVLTDIMHIRIREHDENTKVDKWKTRYIHDQKQIAEITRLLERSKAVHQVLDTGPYYDEAIPVYDLYIQCNDGPFIWAILFCLESSPKLWFTCFESWYHIPPQELVDIIVVFLSNKKACSNAGFL